MTLLYNRNLLLIISEGRLCSLENEHYNYSFISLDDAFNIKCVWIKR